MQHFITNIKINHLRHLKNIDIKIDNETKKHLILTGKNGSGKSSVLNKINEFCTSLVTNTKHIENFFKYKDILDTLDKIAHKPLIDVVNLYNSCYPILNNQDLIKKLQANEIDFIYSYFKAKRENNTTPPEGIKKINLSINKASKLNTQFLQYIVNLKAEKSFANDDGDTQSVKKIDKWFENFEKMLKQIFNDNSLKLIFDRKNYNFTISVANRDNFDFNTLSDGYSAVIDIITELIMKVEATQTKSFDCEGIVLIDELETHLHLELQKNILPFLTTFFPNIQFIITTHSPFVLQSIENSVIYDLESGIRAEDLSGASYTGLVRRYFGIDSEYSKVIENKVTSFKNYVKNKDNLKDEEIENAIELDLELKNLSPLLSAELFAMYQEYRKVWLNK